MRFVTRGYRMLETVPLTTATKKSCCQSNHCACLCLGFGIRVSQSKYFCVNTKLNGPIFLTDIRSVAIAQVASRALPGCSLSRRRDAIFGSRTPSQHHNQEQCCGNSIVSLLLEFN